MMARVLFVTSRVPYPPQEGHQLRAWHLLRAAARKHRVTLLSLRRPEDPACPSTSLTELVDELVLVDLPPLGRPSSLLTIGGRWLAGRRPLLDIRYASGGLRRAFVQCLAGCDLVHVDMLALAGLLEVVPPGIPTVLNEHNVESALLDDRIALENGMFRRMLLRAQRSGLARFEHNACRRADRVLACSRVDARHLQTLVPRARVRVVPNGVDTGGWRLDPSIEPVPDSLVFVGHLGWFPNRDGVEYFAQDILPRLEHRRDLRLEIIGRSDGFPKRRRLPPQLRLAGFVDDLEARVARAAVFIVPLRAGSGTRLKVLEAMAMGKAIVSTTKGVEGIELVDGRDVLIADRPEAFAAAVERLLDDPALRRRLGASARRLVETRYDWGAVGRRLVTIYDELLATAEPARVVPLAGRATRAEVAPGFMDGRP